MSPEPTVESLRNEVAFWGGPGSFAVPLMVPGRRGVEMQVFNVHRREGAAHVDFATPSVPGEVRLALGFRAGDGLITSETREHAAGAAAVGRLLLYWAVIRGPSGLVRRQWLQAVVARAMAAPAVTKDSSRSEARIDGGTP